LGIGPNPQSPIPNPQSPIPNPQLSLLLFFKYMHYFFILFFIIFLNNYFFITFCIYQNRLKTSYIMSQVNVTFSLDGANTVIQCNENDSLKDIFTKFLNKSLIDKSSLYCLYGGKVLSDELNQTYSEVANEEDKKEKKMNIIVTRNPTTLVNNDQFIISKNIICPTCKEICEFEFNNNYTISLLRCKNGHKKENIPLNEFEECQKINESGIICEVCKENNKGSVKDNQFYRCLDCKINLCPICKSKHDEDDYIIDHDRIIFNCMSHKIALTKYCINCKLNICDSCKEEHKNHEFIDYNDINSDKKELKNELKEQQKLIDELDSIVKEIGQIFQKVKENFQIAYQIKKRILDNYCIHRRTYQVLKNLKRIKENNIVFKDLQSIVNQDNILQKFMNVLKTYEKIVSSDNDNIGSIDNEKEELKKENQKLKELNSQLKIENDELCKSMGNQNINIKKLEREKDKLENQYSEMENERQKYQNNLMLKERQILNLKKDNEQKSKELFIKTIKEKDNFLTQRRLERINFLENKRLNEKIKELEKNIEQNNSKIKDDDNDEYEEIKQKLSLIQKIIDYGIDPKTLNDQYNKPGNKCLLIDLVLSNNNYLTSEDVAMTMLEVDRSDFVPNNPYQNKPQTLEFNIKVSAPYMYALALEFLKDFCTEKSKILELGSGSGYLTCALARLTNYKGLVIGVEPSPKSIAFGKNNIKKNHANLINKNIFFVDSDEINKLKKFGPFKAIYVGFVVEEIPEEFLDLLDYNGRILALVGENGEAVKISIVDKDLLGHCTLRSIMLKNF